MRSGGEVHLHRGTAFHTAPPACPSSLIKHKAGLLYLSLITNNHLQVGHHEIPGSRSRCPAGSRFPGPAHAGRCPLPAGTCEGSLGGVHDSGEGDRTEVNRPSGRHRVQRVQSAAVQEP
ncbi:hypothetical protein UPYG_G00194480 [Umbra pygmaea]|uniref:Uncharacterized protein n=1 Tax=Umbra pygmaea TaxID=75934 RepID=A0ABD0WGV7_UMBPY